MESIRSLLCHNLHGGGGFVLGRSTKHDDFLLVDSFERRELLAAGFSRADSIDGNSHASRAVRQAVEGSCMPLGRVSTGDQIVKEAVSDAAALGRAGFRK